MAGLGHRRSGAPEGSMSPFSTYPVGVNWWLGSSGPETWSRFDLDEVDRDFARCRAAGFNTLRVMLRWEDFQKSDPVDVWMDEDVVARLDAVIACARKHELRIVLTLFVAWMCGVYYKPRILADSQAMLDDPEMLRIQRAYVEFFGKRYAREPGILAWNLANENYMAGGKTRGEVWNWMTLLADGLRKAGVTQPVTTGVNLLGFTPANGKHYGGDWSWYVRDASDAGDYNVTHPYMNRAWNSHLTNGALAQRTTLWPAFMARAYEGIGRKPVMLEEFGTLGDMVMDDELTAPQFVRRVLFSGFANGNIGSLYWSCIDYARDQVSFDLVQFESGTGVWQRDGRPKAFAKSLSEFAAFAKATWTPTLVPERRRAAIVVSPQERDGERAVFHESFLLAKAAGIDPDIIAPDQDFSPYALLIWPGHGEGCRTKDWMRLQAWVKAGGTLYLSHGGAYLADFRELFGLRIVDRVETPTGPQRLTIDGATSEFLIPDAKAADLLLNTGGATVHAADHNGPVLSEHLVGTGRAWFSRYPIEHGCRRLDPLPEAAVALYRRLRDAAGIAPLAVETPPGVEAVAMRDGARRLIIVVNHNRAQAQVRVGVAGWRAVLSHGATDLGDGRYQVADVLLLERQEPV